MGVVQLASNFRTAYRNGSLNSRQIRHIETSVPNWSWEKGNKTADEWVEVAETIARNNGGTLPQKEELIRLGYGGLVSRMRAYPYKFAHILMERGKRSLAQHVCDAERLAKDNGGALPSYAALREMGYGGLSQAVGKHPKTFAHIEQELAAVCYTDETCLNLAKRLAQDNDGLIPASSRLRDMRGVPGAYALKVRLITKPELFAGLKREILIGGNRTGVAASAISYQKARGTAHLNYCVTTAEELAASNGGVLQSRVWLESNGHRGVVRCMMLHPGRFNHIEREYLKNSVLTQAEELFAEMGYLPTCQWLKTNGHSSVARAISTRRYNFGHIPQEVRKNGGVKGGAVLIGFKNGTVAQRKALCKKHGIPYKEIV